MGSVDSKWNDPVHPKIVQLKVSLLNLGFIGVSR